MKRLCYCLLLLLLIMIGTSPNIARSAAAADTISPTNFDNDVKTLMIIRKGFQETIAYGVQGQIFSRPVRR